MATNGGSDRVSNAVLATKLDHVNQSLAHVVVEMRALRAESVRADLYDAHRAATDAELTRIREQCRTDTDELRRELVAERTERATLRRQLAVSVVTGGLGIIAALVAALAG